MKYVIDSSVAFKWVVPEVHSDKADRLLQDYRNAIHQLLSTDILPAELANALVVAERRGRIPSGQGGNLLATALLTPPLLHDSFPDLITRAHSISISTVASVYDCLYVALAEREQCECVTADDRLVKNLQLQFPFIVSLASLP